VSRLDSALPDPNSLLLRGQFVDIDGAPIPGAAAYEVFLGDPPSNCGTTFDLNDPSVRTDDLGQFQIPLPQLNRRLAQHSAPGAWCKGCFAVLAIKDSRTLGFVVASGEELARAPARITAVPRADLRGQVVDEDDRPVAGGRVEVDHYYFFVGRGPYPSAPINFWLSRSGEQVADLAAVTGVDGSFLIPSAPAMPGRLDLTVSHPDFATLEASYFPFQPMVRLVMQPGSVVRLRVALPDGSPARRFTFVMEGAAYRTAETDAGGVCEFRALPSGSYTARYIGGGPGGWAVPAVTIPDLGAGEKRDVPAGAVAGSVLCGRVCEEQSGAPIRFAEVRFESATYPGTASTFQAAYTGADGAFAFRYPVVPGSFTIRVSSFRSGRSVGQRHRIVVGTEPRTELNFRLPVAGEDAPYGGDH
jgi:hypothetical protein